MHNLDLILTLTGGLAAALLFGYFTQRVGLSPVVGYLLAGLVVGPNTPGFVANKHLADQLAEVGVILLMFGVGLQFHLKELLEVRRVAVPGALGQILAATALGCVIGSVMNWSWAAGAVFGLAISVASTVVLLRVLSDNNDLHTPTGHIAVGWLVVEDLFTVLVLVLLPVIFRSGGVTSANVLLALAFAVAKLAVLVAFTLLVGGRLIPWVLSQVTRTKSRELFTLTILVVALGIAVTSAMLFGASMALGAFLAGMVVGRSDFGQRAASEALPMRDAFAVLFFVSVGMLFDPRDLAASPALGAATLAVILLGKPLAALLIVWFLKCPLRTGLAVSVALAQIGEFSFILATVARDLGLLPESAHNAIVGASIVSISLNPLLYRLLDCVEGRLRRWPVLWQMMNSRATGSSQQVAATDGHAYGRLPLAIVIGYGPVGRTLTRLLRESDIQPVVIELNLDTFRELKREGMQAVYGDASQRDTLLHAAVQTATSLILSTAGMPRSEELIRLAKELNPTIRVFARSVHLREASALRQAGADTVFSGEGEVALSMTECILRLVGATPEQIDRERDRVRRELFSSASFAGSSSES
jgi:K+:H+ antiporter